ncbi:hypothetical protein [[Clostridium] innocuum]|uniref:hypothetical protein n=1 Tax=Clostridium innocuum TaxID=1522 RepID=UPI003A4DC2EE
MDYLYKVKAQLKKMSLEEKDAWILTRAKLISNNKQNDFLMSLSGTKKIIDMPTLDDIDTLCTRIETGDIYLEYVTHYHEFDEDGRYMDDWVVWYNDPFSILPMMGRIFAGCHQLVVLEEYQTVYDLLSRIFELKFFIQEGEDSEDAPEEDYIELSDSKIEEELSYDLDKAATDWIISFMYLTTEQSDKNRAEKLIIMLETSICKNLKPRILKDLGGSEKLFVSMQSALEIAIADLETKKTEILKSGNRNRKFFEIEDKLTRSNELLTDIRMRCLERKKEEQIESLLEDRWNDVCEVVEWLSFEKYIDDQPEIDTVLEICEELVQSDEIQYDDWQLRKKVITDIVEHDYYDCLGASDIMDELAEKLCTNDEEYLIYADILYTYRNEEKAAFIYNQHGREDKYITYLENHLGSEQKNYNALITYYNLHNQKDDAIRVAQLGLKKCKDDLTDIFIFLLLHTRENDAAWFEKLFASAKRRKNVDMNKIDIAMQR